MSDWYTWYWCEPARHTPELTALATARLDAGVARYEALLESHIALVAKGARQ